MTAAAPLASLLFVLLVAAAAPPPSFGSRSRDFSTSGSGRRSGATQARDRRSVARRCGRQLLPRVGGHVIFPFPGRVAWLRRRRRNTQPLPSPRHSPAASSPHCCLPSPDAPGHSSPPTAERSSPQKSVTTTIFTKMLRR